MDKGKRHRLPGPRRPRRRDRGPHFQPPPPAWRPSRQKTRGRAKARSVCATVTFFLEDANGRFLLQALKGPQYVTVLVAPRQGRRANRGARNWLTGGMA